MNRILKKLLPLFFAGGALLSSGAHAVTCETFAAGDTDYVAKLNLLVAGCSPTSNLVSSLPRAAAGGTVDAITATFSPAITLADQTIVAVVAAGANATTTPTFAPNGLTAHTITARGGGALVAGDIAGAGFVALLEYNLANTRWELLNPSASSASGTVTNISGNLDSPKLVIANNGSDVTTSAGITSDGTSQIELGVAGSAVGSVKFRNATSGSITLQPTTGALGTRTITMPATTGTMALTSDIVAPTLTSTYVGYGSGSNLLTGTSDLTYATATGTLTATQAVNAAMRINVWNTSNGTGAFAALTATNDNNEVAQLTKYGTLWTTSGLAVAGWASLYNASNGTLYANAAVADHVWSRGGTAAIREVARLGAGTFSVGLAGTTQGSLALQGLTSGTATITTASAAGTPTLTLPTTTGTLATTTDVAAGGGRVFNGRLTLVSGVPNPKGDQVSKTTLYWTPYNGNQISLYDGASKWNTRTFSEISLALGTLSDATIYDVFLYDNAGTVAFDTLVAWRNPFFAISGASNATPIVITSVAHGLSNGDQVDIAYLATNTAGNGVWTVANKTADTFELSGSVGNGATGTGIGSARSTPLVLQDGTYVKSGATTRLYVGSIYTTSTTTTESSNAKRYVWNYYNRVNGQLLKTDTTSHTYSTAAYRIWRNQADNRLDWITGISDDFQQFTMTAEVATGTAGASSYILQQLDDGYDSITGLFGVVTTRANSREVSKIYTPSAGKHFVKALQNPSNGTNDTWSWMILSAPHRY